MQNQKRSHFVLRVQRSTPVTFLNSPADISVVVLDPRLTSSKKKSSFSLLLKSPSPLPSLDDTFESLMCAVHQDLFT